MSRRILAFAGAACLAAPLCAQQITQKFDYKPVKQIQAIQLGVEKIEVRQIVFAPASEAGGKQRHSVPEAVVSIDNSGTTTAAVGVAIAIYDGDGNLVAAGSGGTRVGWLAPGEKENCAIRFPYVYRNLEKAKTFTLTMEIQKKESSVHSPQSSVPEASESGSKPKTEN